MYFIVTLEIRWLLVRSNFVRKCDTIYLLVGSSFLDYVYKTYWNNFTATFHLRLPLWLILITSQLRHSFVQRVTFLDDVRTILNYGNSWNMWIPYGSYVIKWSFFNYIIFLAHQRLDNVDIFDYVKVKFIVVCLH